MPSDWIEDFVDFTATVRSPTPFRQWAAIGAIAAVLERRVGTLTDAPEPLRPNCYIALVGAPASGKSLAVMLVRKALTHVQGITLGPDNPSPASFMDRLAASTSIALNGGGNVIQSAMSVLCRELGNLLPKYDEGFAANLADVWDNPPIFDSPRRTSKSLAIENPTINIIAASTPATLGRLPDVVWGEGLTSRMIFVYSPAVQGYRDPLAKIKQINLDQFGKRLNELYHDIHGDFIWEDPAGDALRHWLNVEKLAPVPQYGRLEHYKGRRNEHTMKLAMISSVSAGNFPYVTLSDFNRGRAWLLDAETRMPDVFRSMVVKSDVELAKDAHYYLYVSYSKIQRELRKPLLDSDLYKFLENKTTSDRIPAVIKMMEKVGRIKRTTLGGIIPNPFDPHMDIE